MNDLEKVLIPSSEQSKFYSGDCYIFQYSYPGDDREDYLVGTWFGNESTVVLTVTSFHILHSFSV